MARPVPVVVSEHAKSKPGKDAGSPGSGLATGATEDAAWRRFAAARAPRTGPGEPLNIATASALQVEELTAGDWPAVSAIYADGIATRNATFETEVPSWEAWDAAHLADHRLVVRARSEPEILAWAALSPTSGRCVYRGVAENSIYVARGAQGQGLGRRLLTALVERAEADGIWTIEAGVFPENLASLRLHVACGFRVVGIRERIGQLDGAWRDVVFLERRSKEIA